MTWTWIILFRTSMVLTDVVGGHLSVAWTLLFSGSTLMPCASAVGGCLYQTATILLTSTHALMVRKNFVSGSRFICASSTFWRLLQGWLSRSSISAVYFLFLPSRTISSSLGRFLGGWPSRSSISSGYFLFLFSRSISSSLGRLRGGWLLRSFIFSVYFLFRPRRIIGFILWALQRTAQSHQRLAVPAWLPCIGHCPNALRVSPCTPGAGSFWTSCWHFGSPFIKVGARWPHREVTWRLKRLPLFPHTSLKWLPWCWQLLAELLAPRVPGRHLKGPASWEPLHRAVAWAHHRDAKARAACGTGSAVRGQDDWWALAVFSSSCLQWSEARLKAEAAPPPLPLSAARRRMWGPGEKRRETAWARSLSAPSGGLIRPILFCAN